MAWFDVRRVWADIRTHRPGTLPPRNPDPEYAVIDDHRQIGEVCLDVSQQLEAGLTRHANIRNQHLRYFAGIQRGKGFGGRSRKLL